MSDQQDYVDDQQQIPADQQTDGDGEETEVEAQGSEETETEEDGDESGSQDKPKKRRNRPGKTERELQELRGQVQYLGQLLAQERQQGDGGQQSQQQAAQKPQYDQYDSEEQYLDALASYYADQRIQEREQRQRQESERQRQQREVQERQQTLSQKLQEGVDKYDDFEEVVYDDSVPINQHMADALADSDNAADIAYYLGSNPKEAQRIAQMSPIQAARAIGLLEYKVQQPKSKQTSKAPAPVRTVRGGGGTGTPDPNKMSVGEYMKARNEGKI